MKIKPVLDALEGRRLQTTLVHTGQHYESSMSAVFFEELGLRAPDVMLGAGSGTHAEQTAAILVEFEDFLHKSQPDVVIVVGDVNSTLACGLATSKTSSRLAHVEAGLRSKDRSMPEEVNRIVVDHISDYLLAPSDDAVENLRREGLPRERVCLAGNVMVDTLLANLPRATERDIVSKLGVPPKGFALVTMHRPSNVDSTEAITGWLAALEKIASVLPVLFPVHPRTAKRLQNTNIGKVQLLPPLGYLDFISLEAQAAVVITDSGGVQEETTVLGVPCLTVRESTERPITVLHGTNKIVGTDPAALPSAVTSVLHNPPPTHSPPLWDGRAAARIIDFILQTEA